MLKSRTWRLTIYAALSAAILALSGCKDFTLGGQILGADLVTPAHFGGNFHCDDSSDLAFLTGQFQYRDPSFTKEDSRGKERSLQIHVSLNDVAGFPVFSFASCEEADDFLSQFFGEGYRADYCPQPKKLGACGEATILIEDVGQQGPDKGDIISIELAGGFWDGYVNGGPLLKGQITNHTD